MAFQRFTVNLKGKHRKAMLEGRRHLVVPAVILAEGVISGSGGPLFYPEEENARDPHAWDHMPIVVDHPKDGDTFVSARTPEFIDTRKVGILLNSAHDDKLKTECWFDEERTKKIDKRVYDAIKKDQQMEVSTGLDLDIEPTKGSHNGDKYKGIARNHKPDHLAVLPDKLGACKGAGLFANAANVPESTNAVLMRGVENALKSIGVEVGNEMSFSDISSALSDLLSAKYGEPGKYWNGYIMEVTSSYVVFCDKGVYYKMEYTATDDGVSLSDDAVPVTRTIEYKAVSNMTANEVPNPEEENAMAFDKKAHVASLIANGQIKEKDRAKFEALDEGTLSAIEVVEKATTPAAPAVSQPQTANTAQTVQNAAPAASAAPQQPVQLTRDQWLAAAPPEFIMTHNQGMKALNRSRETFVNTIKASPNNKFTDAALAKMDIDDLAAMAELAKGSTANAAQGDDRFLEGWAPDYGGAVGYAPQLGAANEKLEEAPVPPDDGGDDMVANTRRRKKRRCEQTAAE